MSQVEEIFVMDIEEEPEPIAEAQVQAPEAPAPREALEEELLTPEENDVDGNNFINDELIQLREDPHMFDLSRIVRQRN